MLDDWGKTISGGKKRQFHCQSLKRVSKRQFGTKLLWTRCPLQFSLSFTSEKFAAGIFCRIKQKKKTVSPDFWGQWRHQKRLLFPQDCLVVFTVQMFRLILFFLVLTRCFVLLEKVSDLKFDFFKPSTCEFFVWSQYWMSKRFAFVLFGGKMFLINIVKWSFYLILFCLPRVKMRHSQVLDICSNCIVTFEGWRPFLCNFRRLRVEFVHVTM